MSRIITPRERVECESYSLYFGRVADPGSGYGFDCDKNGVVSLNPETIWTLEAVENFRATLEYKGEKYNEPVIRRAYWTFTRPAVLRCDCGCHVQLSDPMDNVCDNCNAIYNMGGQRVKCLARDVDWFDAGEVYESDD